MEATKLLKPLVQRVAKGDLASMQAVTRVNAEQASKSVMQRGLSYCVRRLDEASPTSITVPSSKR